MKTINLSNTTHRRLKFLSVKTSKSLEYHVEKATTQYLKREERRNGSKSN